MGLSGPKQKQRLVGSASTRNTAWLNDASAPGQRMLAQMGWSAGQSLGLTMPGLTENLKVAYKMDNKGIGSQRHEREARANGKDIWVGGGGDLGSLFERLNAANASSSSSAVASSSNSGAEEDDDGKRSKKTKRQKKEKKDAVAEIKRDVVQGRPVRLAHRAKFLRAKRMVSANDLASVNEILGIVSTPSSSAAGTPKSTSGISTPTAPPKTYPGPGGSEIPLMDVDRRLEAEKDGASDSNSTDDETGKKKVKKDKKRKEKEKEDKKKSKKHKFGNAETVSTPPKEHQAATETAAAEEKEKSTQIGTNSQGLFVFEYLNRRLMLRKAQIAKQKKAEQEAIFARAARVGA